MVHCSFKFIYFCIKPLSNVEPNSPLSANQCRNLTKKSLVAAIISILITINFFYLPQYSAGRINWCKLYT